jgi:hypothetical protein
VKVNICGGGRWANEYLKETLKISKVDIINVYTNNKKLKYDYKKIKKINFFEKVCIKSNLTKSKTIVCNNLKDHIFYAKKFLKNGSDVLIEKPVFNSQSEIKKIKKYKDKIFISKIHNFNYQIQNFINKINLKKINQAEVIWYDKPQEIRRGELKKHDLKKPYIYDVLHHIINIIELMFPKSDIHKNIKNIIYKKKKYDESIIILYVFKIKFLIKISRIKKKRKRSFILKSQKKFYILNFSKKQNKNIKKKRIYFPYLDRNDMLIKMINYFLFFNGKKNKLSYENSTCYFEIYKMFFENNKQFLNYK